MKLVHEINSMLEADNGSPAAQVQCIINNLCGKIKGIAKRCRVNLGGLEEIRRKVNVMISKQHKRQRKPKSKPSAFKKKLFMREGECSEDLVKFKELLIEVMSAAKLELDELIGNGYWWIDIEPLFKEFSNLDASKK